MSIARTILAFLIALSVATLPVAGVAAVNKQMVGPAVSEPMHDCCPSDAVPCDKAIGDCTSMAACALNCFNFAGGYFVELVFPLALTDRTPSLAVDAFRGQAASPPFRPPAPDISLK